MPKEIKLYHILSDDKLTYFWSTQKPFIKREKLIKERTFPLPLKEGFYGKDYLNPTDVEFIKKELKLKEVV